MNHAVNGITAQYAWKVASIGALGFSSLVFGFMLGQKDFIARAPQFPGARDFIPTQELRLEPAWLAQSTFDFSFDQIDEKEIQELSFSAPEVRAISLPRATKVASSKRRTFLAKPVMATRAPVRLPAAPAVVQTKQPVPLPVVAAKLRSDFFGAIASIQKRRSEDSTMLALVTAPKNQGLVVSPALTGAAVPSTSATLLESAPLPIQRVVAEPLAQVMDSKALSIRPKVDDYSAPVVISSRQIVAEKLPVSQLAVVPPAQVQVQTQDQKLEEEVPFNKEEFALALASEALSNPTSDRLHAIEEFVAREEDRSVASEVLPPRVSTKADLATRAPEASAQILDVSPISIAKVIPKEEPAPQVLMSTMVVPVQVPPSVSVTSSVPVSLGPVAQNAVTVSANQVAPQNTQGVKVATTQNAVVAAATRSAMSSVSPENVEAAAARIQETSADVVAAMDTPADSQNYCGLSTHKFKLSANPDTLDSHPCVAPEWIAKSYSGSAGWIRLRPDGLMPTLFAGNVKDEAVLLMDSNSIAMLALKVGSRVVAGTGHIVGVLPEGYKVKVSGKTEDTDTFTYRGSRYFSAVNIAPGANVVLIEKSGEATVPLFAPVLQDSITFLDASKIEKIDLNIQVQKLGGQASEIQSVPVRHAMFDAISTLSNSQGVATLRGVPVVRGYPLFVDVRSKQKDRWGPTYRFEVAARSGSASVYMPSDEQLQGWVNQGAEFRSDSGWVLGAVSKERLDGYRRYSFAKVQPLERETPVDPTTFAIGFDGKLSASIPLEGNSPRFLGTRVPGGLAIASVVREDGVLLQSRLLPISPMVIQVVAPPTF